MMVGSAAAASQNDALINKQMRDIMIFARIYRPAFSWKQAQNARIQSLKTRGLGSFCKNWVYNFRHLFHICTMIKDWSYQI